MRIYFYLFIVFITVFPVLSFGDTLQEDFYNAIIRNDLQAVQNLIDKQPSLVNAVFMAGKGKTLPITPLCMALQLKQKEISQLLLTKGADPRQDSHSFPPLCYASGAGYCDMIPLLVKQGDTPNPDPQKAENCPLSCAKDIQTAQALIACGADVNYRNKEGNTPLHSVSLYTKTEMAGLLLQKGADVNAKNNQGRTPLHEAARGYQVEMAAFLLDHGADVHARNNLNLTPLEYCIQERTNSHDVPGRPEYYKILHLLISKGSLYTAEHLVRAGDMERLITLFAAQPEQKNMKDRDGNPLLICAIQEGQADIAEFLVQQGADVNTAGKWNPPALHTAAYAGNPDIVEMLLSQGADMNKKGYDGETALHWVSIQPQSQTQQQPQYEQYDLIARMLISAGVELDVQAVKPRADINSGIGQPVDEIKEFLRMEEVKGQIVQIRAPMWLAYNAGDTPLHSASRWGRFGIVEMLVKAGAKIDIPNDYGQMPLHYAIAAKHNDILKRLLDKGANPDTVMKDVMSATQLAEKMDNKEAIELLAHFRSVQK